MTLDKNRGLTLLGFRIHRKVRVIVSISIETKRSTAQKRQPGNRPTRVPEEGVRQFSGERTIVS